MDSERAGVAGEVKLKSVSRAQTLKDVQLHSVRVADVQCRTRCKAHYSNQAGLLLIML